MRIVCALDVHRRQITYAFVDVGSGALSRGRITPATREAVRVWLARFDVFGEVHFALEGTTGWRFVVEEIERAGHGAHLADPAETAVKRGRKRRAKTDRADCDLLLRLLAAGELPESWIPPEQILELRTRVRLRKRLIDERTGWQQRLQAQLFHQCVPPGLRPRTRRSGGARVGRAFAGGAGAGRVGVADDRNDRSRAGAARPRAVADRAAVRRRAGDRDRDRRRTGRCAPLRLLRRCCPPLRPRRHRAPVGPQARARSPLPRRARAVALGAVRSGPAGVPPRLTRLRLLPAGRAADRSQPRLSVRRARKLCRRAHHILRELGDDALAPIEPTPTAEEVTAAA
jgi:Transposase